MESLPIDFKFTRSLRSRPADESFACDAAEDLPGEGDLDDVYGGGLDQMAEDSPYSRKTITSKEKPSEVDGDLNFGTSQFPLSSPSYAERRWTDTASYSVKKKLQGWCRLPNGNWALGKILSTSGAESTIAIGEGKVLKVDPKILLPANPDILNGADDLMQLSYLNEPSVLYNLQFRYCQDMIYTKAGPVLVAINPFKEVPLYGNDYIEGYRCKSIENPHVYALADTAICEMTRGNYLRSESVYHYKIFESLQDAGIKVGIYHGRMASKAREESHRSFVRDELQVMVATIAFGMGIDKPNIRCVIHYGCPKSLESYYQESGRCGRDGIASTCWLYYTRSAFSKADFYCAEAHSENQRQAIMASLMAAQKYCMLATCRRKFLLEYFGEKVTFSNCGNCDNCTSTKRERDMSTEAFLLLNCIQSCGGRWGLNVPIDVLRGSRSKKILDNHLDKLSLHGLGKGYSSNWWKALADQLITHGYLKETVNDVYRTVGVGPMGMQFLRSSNNTHQPPLVLPMTSEMLDEEEHRSSHANVNGDLQNFPTLECEGFSEAELKLYHILLEMRRDLAKNSGTAPYAICGDQTIKKIAKIRPSTKARLANIDGVNQQLVTVYGDNFLQHIGHLSQELNLSLDGESTIQTAMTKKVYPNAQRKLTPAKFEAWEMWQKDGCTFQNIANFRGIKESTVFSYVLEAAQEGLETDWARFCKEIDLTTEIIAEIHDAVSKVGSKDKLKPIKDELPEHVTYTHIKVYITMQDLGISTEGSLGTSQPLKTSQVPEGSTESLALDEFTGKSEASPSHELEVPILDAEISQSCSTGEVVNMKSTRREDFLVDEIPLSKCQRLHNNMALEATESAVLEWIGNHDGVAQSDILKHFRGSKAESVVDLLNFLESEFLIFRKNDLYRLM